MDKTWGSVGQPNQQFKQNKQSIIKMKTFGNVVILTFQQLCKLSFCTIYEFIQEPVG